MTTNKFSNKSSLAVYPFLLTLLVSALTILACNGDPVEVAVEQSPTIEEFTGPEKVFLDDPAGRLFQVRVADPQGVSDIASVILEATSQNNQSTSFQMRDEGADGDILANDGQFVVKIPGATWQNQSGIGTLIIQAADQNGNIADGGPYQIIIEQGSPGATPEILQITLPDSLFTSLPDEAVLSAFVSDDDGVGNISQISYAIFPPAAPTPLLSKTLELFGVSGNIGLYRGTLNLSEFGSARGVFTLRVSAQDDEGNRALPGVINFYFDAQAPTVREIVFPDTVRSDASDQVQILATIDDPNNDVQEVRYRILPPAPADALLLGALRDDGTNDDGVAGNGVFGVNLQSSDFQNNADFMTLAIIAEDAAGNRSREELRTIVVTPILDPNTPVILSVSAPDTVQRPLAGARLLTVTARVVDPNGAADIQDVFFNSIRPDGQPAAGNPFTLFDDGFNGDETANDGVFTIVTQIPSTALLGEFRFEFVARDRSGLESATVVKRLVVTE